MKSFVLSLVLFLVIIGVCLASAFFCESSCQKLKESLAKLPEHPQEAASSLVSLQTLWEQIRPWMALCAHNRYIAQWEKELTAMEAAVEAPDPISYVLQKRQLSFTLEELRLAAGFSSGTFS